MSITPSGTEYTIRSRTLTVRQTTGGGRRCCNLVHVILSNNINESLKIPCFSCSRFALSKDYYTNCTLRLTTALLFAADISYYCARKVAEDVVDGNIFVANMGDTRFCLKDSVRVQFISIYFSPPPRRTGQKMKPVKLETLMEMVDAKEGDRLGSGWVASEHKCSKCIEEIERPWFSLKMPSCGHVFHEKYLLRWLYNRNVCPLCRFELRT